jgi:hypothetical protein
MVKKVNRRFFLDETWHGAPGLLEISAEESMRETLASR